MTNNSLKLIITVVATCLLSACSGLSINTGIKDLAIAKPKQIGKQPVDMVFNNKDLQLNGAVKTVKYAFHRFGSTSEGETSNITLSFDKQGRISKISGDEMYKTEYGMLSFIDSFNHSTFKYHKNGGISEIRMRNKQARTAFVAKPQLFGEQTGNLRSVVFAQVKNKKTNSERKYRQLLHYVYAGDRYIEIAKRNDEPNTTTARVIVTSNNRLRKEYQYPTDDFSNYDDSNILAIINAPGQYNFKLTKEQHYDSLGRIIERVTQRINSQLVNRISISYGSDNNPQRIISRDNMGNETQKVEFSNYKYDAQGNWISRTSSISAHGSQRQSTDNREISYY